MPDYAHYDGVTLRTEVEGTEVNGESVVTYKLERPITFLGSSDALAVTLPSELRHVRVEALLESSDSFVVVASEQFDIPHTNSISFIEYRLPLSGGSRISGMRIAYIDPLDSPASAHIVQWATKGAIFGYRTEASKKTLILGTDIETSFIKTNPSFLYEFDVRRVLGAFDPNKHQVVVDLYYSFPKEDLFAVGIPNNEKVVVSWIGTEGAEKRWHLTPRPGSHVVHLYEAVNGFIPAKIAIMSEREELHVTGFEVRAAERHIKLSSPSALNPLPADLGSVVLYDSAFWRTKDFELFSWNLYPEILLIDLQDYALQSRYFKRLAFFVEKEIHAGSLLTNDQLDGLHGWNAHDYWAVDLAAFYNMADKIDFVLNPEEEILRELLYENGILIRANPIEPGSGAILSLARESSDYLRRIFINHEGYHGLYFASPEFRVLVADIWNDLSSEERDFWRLFLAWKRYDVTNEDLVINEFQAYLMQQATSLVDGYFVGYNVPRMAGFLENKSSSVAGILSRHPDMFRRAAELVENAAYRETGVLAFDLLDLTPIE